MKTTFYPAVNDQFGSIAPVKFGIAVHVPDDFNPLTRYPCQLFIHGMGNLGAGSKGELENLWLGYAYGPNGSRVNPAVPQDYMTSIEKYDIVTVFVNYKEQFQPEHFKYVYDLVQKNFSVAVQWMLEGFSWGAGAVMKILGSQYAKYVCVACPCAATYEGGITWSYAKDVCAWLFVNDKDDNEPTALTVTQKLTKDMNAAGPTVKATYTAFRQDGHGGTNQMLTIVPPQAPGGQGVTTAAENIYMYYLDVVAFGPRQPKAGTEVQPVPPQTEKMVAAGTVTQVGDILKLDGSASSGWAYIGWRVDRAPAAINKYTFIKSGGWKTSDTSKVVAGDYQITLILTAADTSTVTKTFNITVAGALPAPKTPVSYSSATGLVTFSDGSQDKLTIIIDWVNRIFLMKTSTGEIIGY